MIRGEEWWVMIVIVSFFLLLLGYCDTEAHRRGRGYSYGHRWSSYDYDYRPYGYNLRFGRPYESLYEKTRREEIKQRLKESRGKGLKPLQPHKPYQPMLRRQEKR